MSYTAINVPAGSKVPAPPAQTWTNLKVHKSGYFCVSGMVAQGPDTYEQARTIFGDIKALVEAAGGHMDDVLTMQIFVVDLNDNLEIWRARREFFSGDFPCSTLIQAVRVGNPQAQPPMRVEINCAGYIGGSAA
jgi:2-iminobutanoate/2-iminopropanoate deaminase